MQELQFAVYEIARKLFKSLFFSRRRDAVLAKFGRTRRTARLPLHALWTELLAPREHEEAHDQDAR